MFRKPIDRKQQNPAGRQTRVAKVEGVNLNGGAEQRRSGCDQFCNNPACFECGNTDRFKARCPICLDETKRWTNTPPPSAKPGEKGKKGRNGEKGKGKYDRFTPLETSACELGNGAMPESQVNVTARGVKLSGVLRESARCNKYWPVECSSIIDTGRNGGGLRIYAWLRKYIEYLERFYHRAAISKNKRKLVKISVWKSRMG